MTFIFIIYDLFRNDNRSNRDKEYIYNVLIHNLIIIIIVMSEN